MIMMPLPNVTGALHMGHAMDGVMQDLLTRWHRMQGDNTLWMPGVDHAGIATQAVVEKRLLELEGKTRHDVGRAALEEKIFQWSDRFRKRIVEQQQAMGLSCDWDRQRYTMDPVCRRAVLWTFFALFRDGLIYRGDRLVNWDCHLQTAISDDEIVRETVQGSFWHLRYPVLDPAPGEPDHVIVATTRPETMLGDTAVACHPDPEAALEKRRQQLAERLRGAASKDRAALEQEMQALEARRTTHLPGLIKLAAMARDGRQIMLPLMDREIPLITDTWARPDLGSGVVKITPAHDPNDYDVWQRHSPAIDIINILLPDGSLNKNAGPYAGLDRFVARERVVADLKSRNLLEKVEDRALELALSDRSKTIIEPYVSRQWFVRMADVDEGVILGRGTDNEFSSPGLAQAALDAADPGWRSPSGRVLSFHPDPERYQNTYRTWLEEKRDWCISRQLWWGHRIPIWSMEVNTDSHRDLKRLAAELAARDDACVRLGRADGSWISLQAGSTQASGDPWPTALAQGDVSLQVCIRDQDKARDLHLKLETCGLQQDPDVLDTWFSSGLWPHSTLGWPDPATAEVAPGQTSPAAEGGEPDALSFYYPGSCLVTGRDIITLWVVRMVVLGLYNMGDVPFTDVFLHATILDGKGERMSKSKGNGIDPVDISARYGTDAMRYVICEMQTGTQDVRLPIQAISPFTGDPVDLATARHGSTIFTYICPSSGKEFDVLGTMPDVPAARLISDRFEVGRAFCNKLWNATRFALLNLDDAAFTPRETADLALEDRWILSRLARTIETVHQELTAYSPSAALSSARDFFWGDLCDWYLEIIKPRLRREADAPLARQVLAFTLDRVLRLLHPFVPFVTEALWEKLNQRAPRRGITTELPAAPLLMSAPWPQVDTKAVNHDLEERFNVLQEVVRAMRDLRSRFHVPPTRRLPALVCATGPVALSMERSREMLCSLAGLESLKISPQVTRTPDAATALVHDVEIHLAGIVDPAQEKARLEKQRARLAKEMEASRRKLENEKFVSRAKPEAVAKERSKAADLERQIASLDENLTALG
ncbi:MAG: valine--tRNA ligase [Acidobacteria bacterium]|nr:MAG: valine--tRNA ligase [Acidobacteriota bacterium]